MWGVRYDIELDGDWVTRSAQVVGRSAAGRHRVSIEADGAGGWLVDGRRGP